VEPCNINILIVEDDKKHCRILKEGLEQDYGYSVQAFRDLHGLQQAKDSGKLLDGFDKTFPLVVILDIMLAEELDHNEPAAPQWRGQAEPSDEERKQYVDYRLGLEIADQVRKSKYEPTIPRLAPILFFTARRNATIEKEALAMSPSKYLCKPAFIDDVHEAIQELLTAEC